MKHARNIIRNNNINETIYKFELIGVENGKLFVKYVRKPKQLEIQNVFTQYKGKNKFLKKI